MTACKKKSNKTRIFCLIFFTLLLPIGAVGGMVFFSLLHAGVLKNTGLKNLNLHIGCAASCERQFLAPLKQENDNKNHIHSVNTVVMKRLLKFPNRVLHYKLST